MDLQEKKELLYKALNQAKTPGFCVYAHGGEPKCVIGQLGHLLGIPVEKLEKWNGLIGLGEKFQPGVTAITDVFPKYKILADIQSLWDNGDESLISGVIDAWDGN